MFGYLVARLFRSSLFFFALIFFFFQSIEAKANQSVIIMNHEKLQTSENLVVELVSGFIQAELDSLRQVVTIAEVSPVYVLVATNNNEYPEKHDIMLFDDPSPSKDGLRWPKAYIRFSRVVGSPTDKYVQTQNGDTYQYEHQDGIFKRAGGIIAWAIENDDVSIDELDALIFRQPTGLDFRKPGLPHLGEIFIGLLGKMSRSERAEYVLRRWNSSYMKNTSLTVNEFPLEIGLVGVDNGAIANLFIALNEMPLGFRKFLEAKPLKQLNISQNMMEAILRDGGYLHGDGSLIYVFHPYNVDTFVHELAHHIDFSLPSRARKAFRAIGWTKRLWQPEQIKKSASFPTNYSRTNSKEDFADSFAEYVFNPSYLLSVSPERAEYFERLELCANMDRTAKCF